MTDAAELTEITIKRYLCRHIHTSGRRCGSPALRGEPFCYYHHTTRRPAPRHHGVHPDHAVFELPAIDDRAGVQFALAQVLARVATDQLDHKRSGRLLNGLFIASRNLPREPRPTASRSSSRSARHSGSSSEDSSYSSSISNVGDNLVEDLILDEELGPIAPIAEAPAPKDVEEERRNHFAEMLDDLLHPKPDPTPDPNQQPATDNLQPATLPTLHAVAEGPPAPTYSRFRYAFAASSSGNSRSSA